MNVHAPFTLDRRGFLKGTGYVALSFSLPGAALAQQAPAAAKPKLPGDLDTNRLLSAWLKINADQTITLSIGKVELGQGILTAVAQVCADQLDVDIERIKIVSGDTFTVPNEGTTAGSQSMTGAAVAVEQAAAEVREILLDLAAKKLGQPIGSLTVANGVVTAANGAKATYGELVTGQELAREATGQTKLKPREQYRYSGKSHPRIDIPPKMLGDAIFVQEYRPAGMVHGRVVRPPAYVAKLTEIDTASVEKMPGVLKVVRNGSFLGVIAQREEQVAAAAAALTRSAKWDVQKSMPGTDGIYDWLLAQKPKDIEIKNDVRKDSTPVAKTIEQTYLRPYHMHASIGTSAAVATLGADGVTTIQTHSQSVFETGAAIAMLLGVDKTKVRCQHMQGSGCYGHNNADDAATDAALLAQAVPGKPVRLQYTRDQEHKWEPYGAAMVNKVKATVDAKGDILDWTMELWSTPHGTRPGNDAGNLLSARYLEKPFPMPTPVNGGPPNYSADRNGIALYEFPGQKVVTHFITEMPVRVSSTRGLGAYANVVAIEQFIDELAVAANADPVEYRLRYLKDPRARDVLVKAAEVFGWSKWQKRANRGRGIAFAKYKNTSTYCAIAMEVEVTPRTGRFRVVRAACTGDAGQLVSPDGVANQLEGGLIQALSWTMKEEVKFDDTKVTSEDWAGYPIITFAEVPPVEVVLIDRPGQPYLGAGEASQGPSGAALANAMADATGKRFRRVPFTPERVKGVIDA